MSSPKPAPNRRPTWDIHAGNIVHARISVDMILNEALYGISAFNPTTDSTASIISTRTRCTATTKTSSGSQSSRYLPSRYRKMARPVIAMQDIPLNAESAWVVAITSFGSADIETLNADKTSWAVNLSPNTPTWPKDRPGVPTLIVLPATGEVAFHEGWERQYVICYPVEIPVTAFDERSSKAQYKLRPRALPDLVSWCKKIRAQHGERGLRKSFEKPGELIYHTSASIVTEHINRRPATLAQISEESDPPITPPPPMDSPFHFPSLGANPSPLPRGLPTPQGNNSISHLFNPRKIQGIFRSSKNQQDDMAITLNATDSSKPAQRRRKHKAATIVY